MCSLIVQYLATVCSVICSEVGDVIVWDISVVKVWSEILQKILTHSYIDFFDGQHFLHFFSRMIHMVKRIEVRNVGTHPPWWSGQFTAYDSIASCFFIVNLLLTYRSTVIEKLWFFFVMQLAISNSFIVLWCPYLYTSTAI